MTTDQMQMTTRIPLSAFSRLMQLCTKFKKQLGLKEVTRFSVTRLALTLFLTELEKRLSIATSSPPVEES